MRPKHELRGVRGRLKANPSHPREEEQEGPMAIVRGQGRRSVVMTKVLGKHWDLTGRS